jgi:N-acetylglucosaminyl-diphospho-decaprenol L-rhamnosyltransferase
VDLSVIVVSFNTRALLRACLASVLPATAGLCCETIVVDNASSDGSAEMVAQTFPEVILIRNETNRGFAAANNQALAVSRGQFVLLLNSDALLLLDTVAAFLRFMAAHPRCGLVGGQLLNPDGSFQASFADFPTLLGELLLLTTLARWLRPATFPSYPAEQSQQARAVDWVFGACMLARRAAIDQVGGLDEDYFMYTEETDWCYRLRQAGWTVNYLPTARVVHWSGQSASRVPERKRSQLYRSKWLFMAKHYRPLTALVFRQAVRLATVVKCGVAWLRVVTSQGRRQELARQHLRSYQLVLAEL